MVLIAKSKKPASMNHRKRTGQHHTQSKPYHKAYWPYLPLLSIIGFGFVLNMFWQQTGGSVLAYATSMSSNVLLQETNAQRQAAGEQNLSINQLLTNAAQAKANDMAARNYWSHVTPDGNQPWWFVTNAGYNYQSTGENLAYGFDTSQATVTGWMNSPGHRANVLNSDYQDVGFGIANVENYQGEGQETIVVALYGRLASQPAPATVAKPKAIPAPAPAATPAAVAVAAQESAPPANSPDVAQPAAPSSPSAVKSSSNTQPPVASGQLVRSPESQPVARLQLFSSNISPLTVSVILLMVAAAATVVFARHAYFWHRTLVRGERFLIKHWQFDIAVVSVVVIGTLLTRTAGFIQ